MAQDFADYTTATVQRLGDRIKYWMTINEIECFTYLGYGVGRVPQHAPGTVVQKRKDVLQTVHHALLAHGLACQAIRAAAKNGAHVSTVINYKPYVPVIETPENMVAAKKAFEHPNWSIQPTGSCRVGRECPRRAEWRHGDHRPTPRCARHE